MSATTDEANKSEKGLGTSSETISFEVPKWEFLEARLRRLMMQPLSDIIGVELKPMVGRRLHENSQLEEQLQIELPVTVWDEQVQEGYYELGQEQDEEGVYFSIPDGYSARLERGDDTVFAGIRITIDPDVASVVAFVRAKDGWNPNRAYRLGDCYHLNLRIGQAPVFLLVSTYENVTKEAGSDDSMEHVSTRVFSLLLRFTRGSDVVLPEVTEIPMAEFREPLGYRKRYRRFLPSDARNAILKELEKIGVN